MKKVLLALVAFLGAAFFLAGCEPAPSTPVAPDVKGPDFTKMSGQEMLDYKKGHQPKGTQ